MLTIVPSRLKKTAPARVAHHPTGTVNATCRLSSKRKIEPASRYNASGHGGIKLDIIKTLQKAERKLEKEFSRIGRELSGLRNAMKALGGNSSPTKRKLSKAARAKIAAGQRKRWAAVKAKNRKNKP
jgi:hypothetical protein